MLVSGAIASRIILETKDGKLIANGMEYVHKGATYRVFAKKEVVVSGGKTIYALPRQLTSTSNALRRGISISATPRAIGNRRS